MPKNKDKREFQHESLEDRNSISAYLQAVREGFAQGVLSLSDQEGSISLEPHGLMNLEVHAVQKRGRARLTLSFSWRERTEDDTPSGGPLKINGLEEEQPDDAES